MESTATSNEAATMQEAAKDEARLESSMAQLHEMHVRLRNLRDTVTRLVDPMLVERKSPEEFYHDFIRNVTKTQTDVRVFTDFVRNDKSRDVFERAAESRALNSENITGWRVTEHEDWLDIPSAETPKDRRVDETTRTDSNLPARTSMEDLRAAMERMKSSHPSIEGTAARSTFHHPVLYISVSPSMTIPPPKPDS
ncbi:MAG: hypothetical protein Q9169_005849 [Polycauliona sp. 2 TL-2023]